MIEETIEETVILRRMGWLLPPGYGLARRDRGETDGPRAPKFRPLDLGSPVEDRARPSPRIAQRHRAYGRKNLPKTEITGQRRISADSCACKLCICRNDPEAIAVYGGGRDDPLHVISPKAPRATLAKASGDG